MIEKPISRLIQILEARSFTVIGCPGAGGIGVESAQIYGPALEGAEGDFIVSLGDVAPLGRDPFYKNTAAFIDSACGGKPVHVVPGVRDGSAFEQYFGLRDRAIISEEFLLVMLDNSGGSFSTESLTFLREILAIADTPKTIVAFALPPPNRFSGRSMSAEAWARFEEAVGVWRKRISLLIAGTVPTYFEDEVEGIRLVVTGGGGASILNPDRVAPARPHVVEVRLDADNRLVVGMKTLQIVGCESCGTETRSFLEEAFVRESRSHIDLLMDAEAAEGRGLPNLARLFRAAAGARLKLACNLRRVLDGRVNPEDSVARIVKRIESGEPERYERLAAAEKLGDAHGAHVFRDLVASAFVHMGLFGQARSELAEGGDIEPAGYFICGSCGVIFAGYAPPDNCSECGAPSERIPEVF